MVRLVLVRVVVDSACKPERKIDSYLRREEVERENFVREPSTIAERVVAGTSSQSQKVLDYIAVAIHCPRTEPAERTIDLVLLLLRFEPIDLLPLLRLSHSAVARTCQRNSTDLPLLPVVQSHLDDCTRRWRKLIETKWVVERKDLILDTDSIDS